MNGDRAIEEALASERSIDPSPFFASKVMAAVRADATFPPLAFPWRRFTAAALTLAITIAGTLAG